MCCCASGRIHSVDTVNTGLPVSGAHNHEGGLPRGQRLGGEPHRVVLRGADHTGCTALLLQRGVQEQVSDRGQVYIQQHG